MGLMEQKNFMEIAQMGKFELNGWIISEYDFTVPNSVETIEELKRAGDLLILATNANSFLTNILSYIVLLKRNTKREYEKYEKGSPEYLGYKRMFEDYVDKETIVSGKISALENVKQTISRLITIKQEINKEMEIGSNP